MYVLRRFHGKRFDRVSAIVDDLGHHISAYVNLVGSATLPLPEVGAIGAAPATACRVEGHLGGRYFPATGPMDAAEALVESETRRLFGVGEGYGINAQPHSATQANHAILRAALGKEPSAVAAFAAADGGHISHRFGIPEPHAFVGLPVSAAGIDYDVLAETVVAARPGVIIAGGSSYPHGIDYPGLRVIADSVGAHLHADLAHTAPFVATGLHPPAFPHVDSATIDPSKNLRGAGGGILVFRENLGAEVRRAIFPILQSAPSQYGLLAKAVTLSAWTLDELTTYARELQRNARLLARALAPALGEPIFGGTDSHLMLFDVRDVVPSGRVAEDRLTESKVLVNRNQIPNDALPPWEASGVRLSSTIPTIVGYDEADIAALGHAIVALLDGDRTADRTIDDLIGRRHAWLVSSASAPTSGTQGSGTRERRETSG